MKLITYSNDKQYLITNEEFLFAIHQWNEKKSYYCERAEALLSPFPRTAETPREELGRKIFLEIVDGRARRIFKNKEGRYMEILDEEGNLMERTVKDKDKKSFKDRLILQEKFYKVDKNKLLK